MASLLAILRALPDDGPALARAASGIDWAALCLDAERHGLSAVVQRGLADAGIQPPPDAHARLLRDARNIAGTSLRVHRLLTRVLDAFARERIRPALLKGYGLAVRFYPEPHLRPLSDVDVLVGRHEIPAAERALLSLGLRRLPDDDGGSQEDYHHHVSFSGPAGLVEVHFRATSGFGTEQSHTALEPRLRDDVLEGRPVRFLLPEDELVYLALHAAQHLFLRLSWLYDLKLLVARTPSLDWSRVRHLADASGMRTAAFAALHLARMAAGADVPASVLEQLRPPAWQHALVERLFTERELVSARISGNRHLAFLVRSALAQGATRAARHLAEGIARECRRYWGTFARRPGGGAAKSP